MQFLSLSSHPKAKSRAACTVEARVQWIGARLVAFTYVLHGELAALKIPAPAEPRRAERLWEHTCFEAFVAPNDGSWYYEFNFSPSGEWAAYVFDGYRSGSALEHLQPEPEIRTRRSENRLELDASVDLDVLPRIAPEKPLSLGLSAVIEESDGGISHWALKHPGDQPDFHHPEAFALIFPPPAVGGTPGPGY